MNKTKNCAGKDVFERLNYLYQLSSTFLNEGKAETSMLYSNLLLNIAKKSVQRIEPGMKRTLCKKCHSLLVPSRSAQVRVRRKKIYWRCKVCCTVKVFKATPGYITWLEDSNSVIEVLRY